MDTIIKIISNIWFITIVGGVIAGLILRKKFSKPKIGFINKGTRTTIKESVIIGEDVGMLDEGEDTKITRTSIKTKKE